MLSKDDLKEYFNQIGKLEADMLYLYKECFDKTEDDKIKQIFKQLSQAEESHQLLVKRITELLQK